MTPLSQLLNLPLLHAIGWSLLHFLWQASLVALTLAAFLSLVPSRYAHIRHAAACLSMLTLVVLPAITLAKLIASQTTTAHFSTSFPISQALTPIWSGNTDHFTGSRLEQIMLQLDHALPAILALWLTGVLILSLRLHFGLKTARTMKRLTITIAPDALPISFSALLHKLHITQTVALAHSAWIEAPIVIGWLRPMILLPIGCIAGLSPLQLEALLAHELAHIRRRDYLISILQAIVEALLFYHPAVWWISSQIRIEREHCCDDIAAAACGNCLAYAQTLSLLETRRSAQPAFGIGAHSGSLLKRIQRLLNANNTPTLAHTRAIVLAAVALMVGSLLLTAQTYKTRTLKSLHATPAIAAALPSGLPNQRQNPSASSQQTEPAQQSEPLQATTPPPAAQQQEQTLPTRSSDPYRAWVEEDVRWIISPQERTAYLALKTKEERDYFITQFWERRNPTPGSLENSFREEHYRRIAYANSHFASKIPGWASDRGQIYIQNGPPDSIDSHPTGSAQIAQPFEDWHFHTIRLRTTADHQAAEAGTRDNVDFRFIDTCNCGNYKLHP